MLRATSTVLPESVKKTSSTCRNPGMPVVFPQHFGSSSYGISGMFFSRIQVFFFLLLLVLGWLSAPYSRSALIITDDFLNLAPGQSLEAETLTWQGDNVVEEGGLFDILHTPSVTTVGDGWSAYGIWGYDPAGRDRYVDINGVVAVTVPPGGDWEWWLHGVRLLAPFVLYAVVHRRRRCG